MLDDSKLAQKRLDLENDPVSMVKVGSGNRLITTPDLTAQRMKALRLIEAGLGDSWLVLQADRYQEGQPVATRFGLVKTSEYPPMDGSGFTKSDAVKSVPALKPGEVAYVLTPVALIAKVED